MICPRCGRMNDEGVDYCTHCGAIMGRRSDTGRLRPIDDDREFQTEVLTESYNDYLDTVVEPVMHFDPSVFQDEGTTDSLELDEPTASPLVTEQVVSDVQPQYPVAISEYTTTSPSLTQIKRAAWEAPTRPLPNRVDTEDSKTKKLLIGIIVGASVIGIVAIIVGLAISFAPRDSKSFVPIVVPASSSSSAAADEGSSDAANPAFSGESETVDSNGATVINKGGSAVPQVEPGTGGRKSNGTTDAEAYKILTAAYSAAADYDSRISTCASDFNAAYKTGSKSDRQSKASAASDLKSQVKSDWKKLADLDMPFWSENVQAWEDLCLCYEYLYNRIDVIDRAWTIDLKYDDQKDIEKHESEILAPIEADNGAGGKNKYLLLFNELYPTIKLVKP